MPMEIFLAAMVGGAGTLAGQSFWKRIFGTRYRTVKECEGCEKRSDEEAAQEDLRRELAAVKKLLLIIAENQGIKPTQLEGLMK